MRKAEQSARTKRALIGAAIELFGERGYQATSLKAIGERSGISHGVIPFHFGSKDGLLLAVVETCFEEFRAAVFGALTGHDRDFGLGDLKALTDALLAFQRERPSVGRLFQVLMFEALGPNPDLRPHFAAFHDRIAAVGRAWIEEGRARGSLRDDIDVEATVDALLCVFTGIRTHSLLLDGFDQRRVHTQLVAILDHGVKRQVTTEGKER